MFRCLMSSDAYKILSDEYRWAVEKHPQFPNAPNSFPCDAICLIAEEFGELAKEVNDLGDGWRRRALVEAAHVAVTAVRTMEFLLDEIGD